MSFGGGSGGSVSVLRSREESERIKDPHKQCDYLYLSNHLMLAAPLCAATTLSIWHT